MGFSASWADGITINFIANPIFSSSNRINNELFIINLASFMGRRNTSLAAINRHFANFVN